MIKSTPMKKIVFVSSLVAIASFVFFAQHHPSQRDHLTFKQRWGEWPASFSQRWWPMPLPRYPLHIKPVIT